MPDTIDDKTLAAQYGFAYSFLRQHPDLYKIFRQAVNGGWASDRFVAAVRNTGWFKQTAAPAREWLLLKSSDPATASERLSQRTSTLSTLAAQLGIKASPAALQQFALSSIMSGWDDNQLKRQMAATYHYSAAATGKGLAGTTVDDLHKIASDYVIPLSDHAIDSWTRQILAGTATTNDFKIYAEGRAKSLYPQMEDAITKGTSPAEFMDPYKQLAAQTLEIPPDSVDWSQPKWQKILNQTDSKGNRKVMDLADAATYMRTDASFGYDKTINAKNDAVSLASGIAKAFGGMG